MTYELILGDCLEVMRGMADKSVDAIITDPPYPEIDRAYGRMSEAAWWEMMMGVCTETRRILKPTGSAVFILQPNSRKVGSMRGWLFEFQAWVCREWNMVQDVYWWNFTSMPTVHSQRTVGLMRNSIKACVWAGDAKCFRNQNEILCEPSDGMWAYKSEDKALHRRASGQTVRNGRILDTVIERGGTTPFNLIPVGVTLGDNTGRFGHTGGTPLKLAKWWTRYICPPGGTVLDPFVGSGTMMLAALEYGCHGIGIERDAGYHAIATKRIEDAAAQPMLLSVES